MHIENLIHYVARCKLNLSANQTMSHGSWTPVAWDVETFDNDNMHDNGVNPERLTVRRSGLYLVIASLVWEKNSTGRRLLVLQKNGSNLVVGDGEPPSLLQDFHLHQSTVVDMAVGDYFTLVGYQEAGKNLDIKYEHHITFLTTALLCRC